MLAKMVKTGRGFKVYPFKDGNGINCTIQESSAARDDGMIWLGCNEPSPRIRNPDGPGWVTYDMPKGVLCDTRMHLTQSQVQSLLPLLRKFARTGKL